MTEPKHGPFDAAIDTLSFCLISGDLREHTEKMIRWSRKKRENQARKAIRVLESYPRWEPLIKAAEKINKANAKEWVSLAWVKDDDIPPQYDKLAWRMRHDKLIVFGLIEALPDTTEKEGKHETKI